MASKYILVLLVLAITGFLTLGVKRLLLLRPGFGTQKNSVNWLFILLMIVMSVLMLSCKDNADSNNADEPEAEREAVVVTQRDEKTTKVHKQIDNKGNVTATVTLSTRADNNEIITEEKVITGTGKEVDAKIKALQK